MNQAPRYVLVALTLFYVSNFVDRAILNILAQPIKEDLGLTDAQLGILGGIAFAALYAASAIPIARLAERFNRVTIITIALTIWSAMTVICAFAMSFAQMAIARAGVGIGEAACTPCAHSLIADSFPGERRATAMSVYSLGIPIGTLVGMLGGAWVADQFGWRMAFIAVGAPGLLLAAIAKLTIQEPPRGRFDLPSAQEPPSLQHVLRHLLSRPAFNHMAIGVTLSTMVSAGMLSFTAAFLLRGDFGLTLTDVGLIMAGLTGVAALLGTVAGGMLADRFGKHDARLYLRLPAAAYFLAGPLFVAGFLQSELPALISLLALAQFCSLIYLGPTFGVLHNMVETRMRATAVAILFVLTSLIGIGLGPVLVGWISDLAAAYDAGADLWTVCERIGAIPTAECRAASFRGVQFALVVAAPFYLWAGVHYWLASRTVARAITLRAA